MKPKGDKIASVIIEADDMVWIRGGVKAEPDLSKEEISQHARRIIERLKAIKPLPVREPGEEG